MIAGYDFERLVLPRMLPFVTVTVADLAWPVPLTLPRPIRQPPARLGADAPT